MDALVIVDFQNDFTPGGALAVPDGDAIAEPIARLLDRFELVVAGRAFDGVARATTVLDGARCVERGVERLLVAGLATDSTASGRRSSTRSTCRRFAVVVVVVDAIRGVEVEPGDSARAVEEMRAAGAVLATTAEAPRGTPRG